MKKNLIRWGALALAAAPAMAFAAAGDNPLADLVDKASSVVSSLLPILMTLAVVVFVWGLVKYIWSAGDPDKAKEGRSIMIWGVVALFVMTSVWGITRLLGSLVGVNTSDLGSPVSPTELDPSQN